MLIQSTRKGIAFLLGYTITFTKSSTAFHISTNSQPYSIQHWNKHYNKNKHPSLSKPSSHITNPFQMNSSSSNTFDRSIFPIPKHWSELKTKSQETVVGRALQEDQEKRFNGHGAPHVSNQLRLFDQKEIPNLTFYRDQAGWCPYCEKTILLIEEKRIPIQIQTVPMRSYGDKPNEFLQMVPNGLLPALVVTNPQTQRKQVITESQVIMELLDQWHTKNDGYLQMLPTDDPKALQKYDQLARLERELFSWWCTFLFRPESPPSSSSGGFSGLLNAFSSNNNNNNNDNKNTNNDNKPLLEMNMSSSMRGFVECLKKVDQELQSTKGPWFFSTEQYDHPTMIDFVYISHIERMLASCAYWKGFQIRGTGEFPGIDAWLDAFDQRESYLAFKSDFYTNVMDIPPQYGPGYYGGMDETMQEAYAKSIRGKDGKTWNLPLDHDEPLEPLYRGLPLPKCVLDAAQIHDYQNANPHDMAQACRHAAGWKLASNGINVSPIISYFQFFVLFFLYSPYSLPQNTKNTFHLFGIGITICCQGGCQWC